MLMLSALSNKLTGKGSNVGLNDGTTQRRTAGQAALGQQEETSASCLQCMDLAHSLVVLLGPLSCCSLWTPVFMQPRLPGRAGSPQHSCPGMIAGRRICLWLCAVCLPVMPCNKGFEECQQQGLCRRVHVCSLH